MVRWKHFCVINGSKFLISLFAESDEISEHFEDMKDTLGATNKSVNKGLAENKETLLKGRWYACSHSDTVAHTYAYTHTHAHTCISA